MKKYVLNLISTPSFWKGVVWFAMAMGWSLDQEQQNSIIGLGLSIQAVLHAWEAHSDASS